MRATSTAHNVILLLGANRTAQTKRFDGGFFYDSLNVCDNTCFITPVIILDILLRLRRALFRENKI